MLEKSAILSLLLIFRRFAMLKVQRALHERRVADAVGIYRAARNLWQADNIFGAVDIAPEDEFLELHAIFFSNLKEVGVFRFFFLNFCQAIYLLINIQK